MTPAAVATAFARRHYHDARALRVMPLPLPGSWAVLLVGTDNRGLPYRWMVVVERGEVPERADGDDEEYHYAEWQRLARRYGRCPPEWARRALAVGRA